MYVITQRSHQDLQCSFEARLGDVVFNEVQKNIYGMNIQYCFCIVTGFAKVRSC